MKKYVFVGPIVILVLWFISTFFHLISPLLLPSPIKVFHMVGKLFLTGEVLPDFLKTIFRWLIGLSIGVAIGIPIGILMGYSDKIYASLEVLIDFLRSLPSITLYPLFILFFGLGDLPKVAIVIFATSLYTTLNTIYGVKYTRESRLLTAKSLRASSLQIFTRVIFPGALPEIFAGIRISVTIGLIVSIGSEMILGARHGLGKRVLDASNTFSMAEMYALIIIIGLLGYLSNRLLVALENRAIHWRGK
jgi:NitT/TauT family transport system permease protein